MYQKKNKTVYQKKKKNPTTLQTFNYRLIHTEDWQLRGLRTQSPCCGCQSITTELSQPENANTSQILQKISSKIKYFWAATIADKLCEITYGVISKELP